LTEDLNWDDPKIRQQALAWLEEKAEVRGFIKGIAVGALLVAIITVGFFVVSAHAEEGAAKPLTVRDVIGIHQVLSDPTFKEFKFTGAVRMQLARALVGAFEIKKAYDLAMIEVRIDLTGEPGKDVPKDKMDAFLKQGEEALNADANIKIPKIDVRDLCLDATPQACSLSPPVKNEISPAMLAGLLPIINQ
jgi:hypothetical protein